MTALSQRVLFRCSGAATAFDTHVEFVEVDGRNVLMLAQLHPGAEICLNCGEPMAEHEVFTLTLRARAQS